MQLENAFVCKSRLAELSHTSHYLETPVRLFSSLHDLLDLLLRHSNGQLIYQAVSPFSVQQNFRRLGDVRRDRRRLASGRRATARELQRAPGAQWQRPFASALYRGGGCRQEPIRRADTTRRHVGGLARRELILPKLPTQSGLAKDREFRPSRFGVQTIAHPQATR
jgi:hypothetical protein